MDGLKDALKQEYERVEDANKIWHLVHDLKQGENESVECFVKKFVKMWEQLCKALEPEHPSAMLKKDNFIAGLNATLQWKIELKKPVSSTRMQWKKQRVENGKIREWPLGPPTIRPVEVKRWEVVPTMIRETIPTMAESQTI